MVAKKIITVIVLLQSVTFYFSQNTVNRQQAKDDIDYYSKIVSDSHYNPFLFISQKQYITEVDKIKNQLPEQLSLKEMTLVMYKVSALLQDAHSNPGISQSFMKEDFSKPIFFPLILISDHDKLYSTVNTGAIPPGAEIISINGKDITPLFKKMKKSIGGTSQFRDVISLKLFSYFLYLEDITPPFSIRYKSSDRKKIDMTIKEGIKLRDFLTLSMPGISKPYEFKMINHQLAYLDFRSMSGSTDDFDTFLSQTFATIRKENIKELAIDLRNNSGGNSLLGDLLLSYITDRKYSLQGRKYWKISQIYKDKLLSDKNTEGEYLKMKNGTVWEIGDCKPDDNKFKNDTIFKGKVYLLTGPFTFSSANLVADGIKQYKLAELIGEPTGEYTNDFGEAFMFNLPNSKIQMRSTSSMSIGADCNAGSYTPVVPDVLITPSLKDKINGIDPALEYILNKPGGK
ncbi:S41 family peptidase [Chryseobacterium sp.]|uniref:S41 family peptidase n=1 Tax=Chryseobacterium sp. TaxID=1871047 RepID=UPI001B20C0B1|nr:S41 family peptidase [Chryseobacterium sp.]MBO9691276.1 hypothetical protein [Chryseobacterium sp.]